MDIGKLEDFLKEKIVPDLKNGRPNDEPHTLLVVTKLKEILRNSPELELDEEVLITAAFAHDWGYTNLLDKGITVRLEHLGALKDIHMAIGSEKLKKLLDNTFFDFLSETRKKRAVHLVMVHDKLEGLKDADELILMEADSLGGMDPEVMGVFGDKDSEERFMRKSRDLRLSKFMTEWGKNEFERLFTKRQELFRIQNLG